MRASLLLLALAPGCALASHPLVTSGTGVVGAGRWQAELHGEEGAAAAALAYGLAQRVEVELEAAEGSGPAAVSAKWRFLEREAFSLAFKPELSEGGAWAANLSGAYDFGRVELIAQAGYLRERSDEGERRSRTHLSAAALLAATERLRLAIDLVRDAAPIYGFLFSPDDDVELGLGVQATPERTLHMGIELRF